MGIRNSILGFRNSDYGHIIENIVFFELLNRGYTLTIGKLEENVRNREFTLLKSINDNYEKTILTLDRVYNETSEDGIKCRNIIDFLLDEE